MVSPNGTPACVSTPVSTLDRPTMLATDRSISPVTMIAVIGSAMMRIGKMSSSRYVIVILLPKFGTTMLAKTTTMTTRAMIALSRVRRRRCHSGRS